MSGSTALNMLGVHKEKFQDSTDAMDLNPTAG